MEQSASIRTNDAAKSVSPRRRVVRLLLRVAVALYLLSGFYMVRLNEQAIVRRFGKLLGRTLPSGEFVPKIVTRGLRYHLPYPIERVDKVKALETKTITVGFEAPDEILARAARPTAAEFLTGDQNIMNLQVNVQYTVTDPVRYVLEISNARDLLKQEATAGLTAIVARLGVDNLIGPERALVAKQVLATLKKELQLHRMGLSVRSVNFQSPLPPQEVAGAFHDVQSAKAEMHRLRLEAESYRNETITRAQGEADKMLRDAEAYAQKREAEAQGEAERFEKIYEEYRKAKELTSLRLYIEGLEEILPRMRKLIVDSDEKGEPIDIEIISTER